MSDLERLAVLYGPDPSKVGMVDGTEDDYGGMLHELTLIAGGDEEDDDARDRLDRMLDAALPATWQAAVDVARAVFEAR